MVILHCGINEIWGENSREDTSLLNVNSSPPVFWRGLFLSFQKFKLYWCLSWNSQCNVIITASVLILHSWEIGRDCLPIFLICGIENLSVDVISLLKSLEHGKMINYSEITGFFKLSNFQRFLCHFFLMKAVGFFFTIVFLDTQWQEYSKVSIDCFLNEWQNVKEVHDFSVKFA